MTLECAHGEGAAVSIIIGEKQWVILISSKRMHNLSLFADMAVRAERLLGIDPEACAIGCRKAMEFAIKWMYTADHFLRMPYKETLVAMINTNRFRELVPDDLMRRIQYVRALGNNAAHAGVQITYEQAALGIENLFYFMDFVACSYSRTYDAPDFHRELLGAENELEKKEALAQEKNAAVRN